MSEYQFIGVDIAKASFEVAIPRADHYQNYSFENQSKGFVLFLKQLKRLSTTPWVCLEATGHYGQALAEYLHQHHIAVSVINPRQVKDFARAKMTRHKNDTVDARVIAHFGQVMQPKPFSPRSDVQKELRSLVNLINTLKQQLQQLRNQADSVEGKIAKRESKKAILAHQKRIERIGNTIQEVIQEQTELNEQLQLLTSIKGVGPVTAIQLLATLPSLNTFNNAKQLAAFVGVSPQHHQSGKLAGKTTLSCQGNAAIRKALYMAALTAKRHNQHLKPFVSRLESRGKTPKAIVGAIMRKLTHLIFGILKSGRPFDPKLV